MSPPVCMKWKMVMRPKTSQSVIGDWINVYNTKGPNSALDGNTPDMACGLMEKRKLAA